MSQPIERPVYFSELTVQELVTLLRMVVDEGHPEDREYAMLLVKEINQRNPMLDAGGT